MASKSHRRAAEVGGETCNRAGNNYQPREAHMKKVITAVIAMLVSFSTLFAADKAAPAAVQKPAGLILDETGYWRHYFSLSPASFHPENWQEEAKKYVDRKYLKGYMRRLKVHNKKLGWPKEDWLKDPIYIRKPGMWAHGNHEIWMKKHLKTGFPSNNWHQAEFDDADWVRQLGAYKAYDMIRAGFYRSRFFVQNPSELKALQLNASFRGGIRIFINGKEVSRKYLPEGEIDESTRATDYPLEAYILTDKEAKVNRDPAVPSWWPKQAFINDKFVLISETDKPFEKQRLVYKKKLPEYRCLPDVRCLVNRETYQRILKVRNRTIKLDIPANLLVKGENVLAVETRACWIHPIGIQWRLHNWMHGGLMSISLTDPSEKITNTTQRLPGVQLWAEDIHRRIYNKDFYELPDSNTQLRIKAARGGTFSAQAVIGTDKELSGIEATIHSKKANDPFTAKVMYPVPHFIKELKPGDSGRRVGNGLYTGLYSDFIKSSYGTTKVPFYEHLGSVPPKKIEAETCYPFWVSVDIPKNTPAGQYSYEFKVKANGIKEMTLPLEITVHDWPIPAPKDFTIISGLEQSPYALAREYKTGLWTDAHWRLIDKSLSMLKRVGNDWWHIPVLAQTEFGNEKDSMVRISKSADGYKADYTILDKYLDLIEKYCGQPKVVSFIVMHPGNPGDRRMHLQKSDIPLYDGSGKVSLMPIDGRMPLDERRAFLKFLSTSIYAHMKARGHGKATYWGYTWDGPGNTPDLYEMLAEFTPGVFWAKGSHAGSPNEYNKAVATVYNNNLRIEFTSRKGWKNRDHWLTYPRYWNTVIETTDYSLPFSFRMMVERAIAAGSRGFSRMGFDFWKDHYRYGVKRMTYAVGVPNLMLTWPGKEGPESSTRYEMLIEGMQETEARIFLEQSLEKLSDEKYGELKKRVQGMLDRRLAETNLESPAQTSLAFVGLCSVNWKKRSNELYQTAAEVAQIMGLCLGSEDVYVDLAAGGKQEIRLPLTNWTSQNRDWTISFENGDVPKDSRGNPNPDYVKANIDASKWLSSSKNEGNAEPGRSELVIEVDTSKLELRKTSIGKVIFSDSATKRSESISIHIRVGEMIHVESVPTILNATLGEDIEQEFTIVNPSARALEWETQFLKEYSYKKDPKDRFKTFEQEPGAAFDWIKCSPASGRLEPGESVAVKVTGKAPSSMAAGKHEASLNISEKGAYLHRNNTSLHILLPYKALNERPSGEVIPLDSLDKNSLVKYHSYDNKPKGVKKFRFWKPKDSKSKFIIGSGKKKEFKSALRFSLKQETIFNVEGKGFKAFAAEVGPRDYLSTEVNLPWTQYNKLSYEIYIDGKAVSMSGLMGVKDEAKLLIAEIPSGAKELKLIARTHNDKDFRMQSAWGNPCFYK